MALEPGGYTGICSTILVGASRDHGTPNAHVVALSGFLVNEVVQRLAGSLERGSPR